MPIDVLANIDCAQEFGLGFYDGISGLITQPIEGAKKQGVAGLIKGFGKGLGGVVLKPGAGKKVDLTIFLKKSNPSSNMGIARIYVYGDL